MLTARFVAPLALAAVVIGCAQAQGPAPLASPQVGPDRMLPQPQKKPLPTVKIAPALGWPEGGKPRWPRPAQRVTPFATGLDHPRWLYVLPNGDVLVAETNAPAEARGRQGHQGLGLQEACRRRPAPACRAPTASRCCATPTATAWPRRGRRSSSSLNSPFGMALVGNELYVANTDALVRFPYQPGQTRITGAGDQGGRPAGRPASTTTGPRTSSRAPTARSSTSPSAPTATSPRTASTEEAGRAAIWEIDPRPAASRVFASGLRNPNGMALGAEHAARCGPWSTSATSSAATSCPTTSPRCRTAPSTAGPTATTGQHVDERVQAAAARPRRQGDRARLRARLARRRRSASRSPTARVLGRTFAARRLRRRARLVEPQAAQRLQGRVRAVPRRQALGRADRCAHRLRQGEGRAYGRPVGVALEARAACSSPTTSATPSGAWHLRLRSDAFVAQEKDRAAGTNVLRPGWPCGEPLAGQPVWTLHRQAGATVHQRPLTSTTWQG